MNIIKDYFSRINKRTKLLLSSLIVISGIVGAVSVATIALAAWGPSRPTYDYNKPCDTADADIYDRCGSLTGPVFNSFVNTPSYGDERNFVTGSPAGAAAWTGENMDVTPGQEYEVRAYVHNNANQSTNANGSGVARNTRVRFYLPTGQANGFDVAGYISADNATPARVYDTVTLKNNAQAFSLDFVEGSARIYNNGAFSGGTVVSEDIIGANGVQIGWSGLDGNLPGCFEYEAVVIIKVKVVAPAISFTKQVAPIGTTNWQENLNVKPGDTVSWLLNYKNNGTDVVNNITIRDVLPAGLTLVPGSITWIDSNNPNGTALPDSALGSGGVNLGNYAPNGGGYIRFRTTVNKDAENCGVKLNQAFVRGDNVSEQKDTAQVTIVCANKPTPPASPVAPSAPTRLPDTGPASVIGLFTATTFGAASLHRLFVRRYF